MVISGLGHGAPLWLRFVVVLKRDGVTHVSRAPPVSVGDTIVKALLGKTRTEGAQTVLYCACSSKAVPGACVMRCMAHMLARV